MKYHKNGFTLIELMIVVGIIGILAGIAIPAYQNQIEKGRRSDCQANMTAAANAMERFRTGAGQGSYATASVGAGGVFGGTCPLDGSTTYYTLTLPVLTQSTYTILATPAGPMTNTGRMTVTHTGQRCWFDDEDTAGGVCKPF